MRVYIAGPMRGIPQFNFPAFDAAKARFEAEGHSVISPADLDRISGFHESDALPDDPAAMDKIKREFMRRDVAAIIDGGVTHVVVLPGWENSKGSGVEVALARYLDLPVIDAYGQPLEAAPALLADRDLWRKVAEVLYVELRAMDARFDPPELAGTFSHVLSPSAQTAVTQALSAYDAACNGEPDADDGMDDVDPIRAQLEKIASLMQSFGIHPKNVNVDTADAVQQLVGRLMNEKYSQRLRAETAEAERAKGFEWAKAFSEDGPEKIHAMAKAVLDCKALVAAANRRAEKAERALADEQQARRDTVAATAQQVADLTRERDVARAACAALHDFCPDCDGSGYTRGIGPDNTEDVRECHNSIHKNNPGQPLLDRLATAEDQKRADERLPHLLACPAACRAVAIEPALGAVDIEDYLGRFERFHCNACGHDFDWRAMQTMSVCLWICPKCAGTEPLVDTGKPPIIHGTQPAISWVIIGQDTGPRARKAEKGWFLDVRDQCAAAGVPLFVKASPHGNGLIDEVEYRDFPNLETGA